MSKIAQIRPGSQYFREIASLKRITGAIETRKAAIKIDPLKYNKVELIMPLNRYLKSRGLRHFWKTYLPTIKFHNDDINFIVTRVTTSDPNDPEQAKKVPVKIHLHNLNSPVKEINVDSVGVDAILDQFITSAEATPVDPKDILFIDPKELKTEESL